MTPATITPPERGMARAIFTESVALELAKLVTPEWLALGIRIAGYTDATGGEWIAVTIGLPTDGRRFQRGRGYTLAEAIGAVRPVCEVAR